MLTRAEELESLAARAQDAEKRGDFPAAKALWEESLALLPPETVQFRSIQSKIADLGARVEAAKQSQQSGWKKAAAGAGPIAAILWKFKALLLGLTKVSTLLTMFASAGVYWSIYGWKFALGLVFSIYIHEMGHVFKLRHYGIPASAPVFIPGFGAFIALQGHQITRVQDSRVGLAGPIYGFGAGLAALGFGYLSGAKIWFAIAHFTAIMNLFNLVPVWQLDGARGYASLTKNQRMTILAAAAALWFVTSEPMLFLIVLGGIYRLFTKDAAEQPDQTGFLQFLGLLAALSALSVLAKHAGAP